MKRFLRKMALRSRHCDALVCQRPQVDAYLLKRHATLLARAQHLFDEMQQPVAVFQHHVVELVPLGVIDGRSARLQGFQVQAD